jgi:hypothetical protein
MGDALYPGLHGLWKGAREPSRDLVKRRTTEWFRMMERRRESAEAAGLEAGRGGRGVSTNPYVGKLWSEPLHKAWLRGWKKGRRSTPTGQGDLEL